MAELTVGDQVLVTYSDTYGNLQIKSSVLLAMDIYQYHNPLSPVEYRKIYTTANTSILHITPSHSLLMKKKYQHHPQYQFAADAEIGDVLYIFSGNDRLVNEVTIIYIDQVQLFDAYAPLTFEGNLIVNDVIVSCYGTFTHSTGHLVKMMRRWSLHWYLHLSFFFRSAIEPLLSEIICYMSNIIFHVSS